MNDLRKYYSEEYKAKLHKIRVKYLIETILCVVLVFIYFCISRSIINLILAIFGGILGVMYLISLITLFVSPETVCPPNGQKQSISKIGAAVKNLRRR